MVIIIHGRMFKTHKERPEKKEMNEFYETQFISFIESFFLYGILRKK
jgi:hypothetical protein